MTIPYYPSRKAFIESLGPLVKIGLGAGRL